MSNENPMTGTVDRFEGGLVLIELPDKSTVAVKKDLLGPDVVEGDRVLLDDQGIWRKDEKATDEARKRIRNLLDDLFE